MKIIIQCSACKGTGIYCGFGEKKGFGVVCTRCDGTGAQTIEVVPFKGLIIRDDVKRVGLSNGYIQGVENNQGSISYEEFLAGKRPEN